MNAEGVIACRTQDVSRPNFSRVMRTNFGDTMVKILREHSDSLVFGVEIVEYNPDLDEDNKTEQ